MPSVINCKCTRDGIVEAISAIGPVKSEKMQIFGLGDSAALFLKSLESKTMWEINHQKQFKDFDNA